MIHKPQYSLVETEIREIIKQNGPISFAHFMELALYHPQCGYYINKAGFGPNGDFFTAPMTHPIFGSLIANQAMLMWLQLGKVSPINVLELGAGNGQLGIDFERHSERIDNQFCNALHYTANDLSPKPSDFLRDWIQGEISFTFENPSIIIANELLDAMPAHRVVMHNGELKEIFIGLNEAGDFQEYFLGLTTSEIKDRFDTFGIELAEGHKTEMNLGMTKWFKYIYDMIPSGYLLLIDYGYEAHEYYNESRMQGTLRCYYAHTLNMNPYIHVGKQDISIHVDFSTLRNIAHHTGFKLVKEKSQSQFLKDLGFEQYRDSIVRDRDLSLQVKNTNLRLLDLLIDDRGMGAFKVFIFAKNAPEPSGILAQKKDSDSPSILATTRHMP